MAMPQWQLLIKQLLPLSSYLFALKKRSESKTAHWPDKILIPKAIINNNNTFAMSLQ